MVPVTSPAPPRNPAQLILPAYNDVAPCTIARSPVALLLSDTKLVFSHVIPHLAQLFLPLPKTKNFFRAFFVDITPLGLAFQIVLSFVTALLFVPLGLAALIGGLTPILAATLIAWPFVLAQGSHIVHLPGRDGSASAKPPRKGNGNHGSRTFSVTYNNGQRRQEQMRGNGASTAKKNSTTFTSQQQQARRLSMSSVTEELPNYGHMSRSSYTADEAWFFINGVATSRSGMEKALHRLQELFNRPITGILNKSLGTFIDLLECVVQRELRYETRDVRTGYNVIRQALEDPTMTRVILLSHSQGGIIASLIIDRLLADVSGTLLEKLEVYTFACAANHFADPRRVPYYDGSSTSNPTSPIVGSLGSGGPLPLRTIRHVEHYANGRDPVSQIGVLAFATPRACNIAIGTKRPSETPSQAAHIGRHDSIKSSTIVARRVRRALTAESLDSGRDGVNEALDTTDGESSYDGGRSHRSRQNTDSYGTSTLPRVASAPHQPFSGRLFVRWGKSGHLLHSHYLFPGDNILDTPEARKYSRLRQYLGGKSPPL